MEPSAHKDSVSLVLFGVCFILAFMPLSHHTIDQRVWYNYAPKLIKNLKLWPVWIISQVLSASCLYLAIQNISEFSRPSSDIMYGTWVISGMILLTMVIIKMFLPLSAFLDHKEKGTPYTQIEKTRIFADDDVNTQNIDKYYHSNRQLPIYMHIYNFILGLVSVITLIIVIVNFINTKSYIAVTVIWSVNTVLIVFGVIYVSKTIRDSAKKDTGNAIGKSRSKSILPIFSNNTIKK